MAAHEPHFLPPTVDDLDWFERNPSETARVRPVLPGEIDTVDWAKGIAADVEGWAIIVAHDRLADARADLGVVRYAVIARGMTPDGLARRAAQMIHWYSMCPLQFPAFGLSDEEAAVLTGAQS